MVFDRTENEPEEWDPEAEYYDSESDGLTIPQVAGNDGPDDDSSDLSNVIDPPEVEMAETDASADLLQTFWALVLVINAAVLAGSLGLLFLLFEGVTTHAIALLVAGLALVGFAARRYRRFRDDDAGTPDDGTETDASPPSAGDGAETEPTPSGAGAETTSRSVSQQESPNRDDRS